MPEHIEFVLSAYGIWIATFALYVGYLLRRTRRVERALRSLPARRDTEVP